MGFNFLDTACSDKIDQGSTIRAAVKKKGVTFFWLQLKHIGNRPMKELVGEAFLHLRKDVVNCYKFGFKNGDSKQGQDSHPDRNPTGGRRTPWERLKTDVIDLFIT